MGGQVDTFVVRLALAMTVIAWGTVLLHDAMTPDEPAESLAPASVVEPDPEESDTPDLPPLTPPTNGTPGDGPSGRGLALA